MEAHEGPREVPARARGGAVRPASRPHVHKGFLRAYADASASTASSTSTSTTPASSRATRTSAPRARVRRRPPDAHRRSRRESGTVVVALVAILLVTALVIAAWRFGGHDEPQVARRQRAAARTRRRPSARRRSSRSTVTIRAVRGPSFMEVRAAQRHAALHGHARAGPDPAVHAEVAVALGRPAAQRRREGERRAVRVPAERPGAHGRPGRPPSAGEPRPRAVDRRHGQRARARRAHGSERAVLAREALALGLEPARIVIVGDDPRRARGGAARGARGATSASSPAGSARRTTTARSSSSRGSPGVALASTRSSRPRSRRSRARSPSGSAGRTPTSRRA